MTSVFKSFGTQDLSGLPCQYDTGGGAAAQWFAVPVQHYRDSVFEKSTQQIFCLYSLGRAAQSTGQNKGIEQFFKVIDLDEQDGEQQLIMNKI